MLIDFGYWGMLLSSFLAGSVFPFSSEAIMLGLLAAGLNPVYLIIYVAGSMFNYGVGRMGKMVWIEKYLHIKKEKVERAQRFLSGHGAWLGVFSFLPVLGSAISVALGLMKANLCITFTSITLGKLIRYIALAAGASLVI